MRYGVVIPRPNSFSAMYNDCFLEQAVAVVYGLRGLGHLAELRSNCFSDEISIIFGANTLPPGSRLPHDSIVYNLEQPDTGCIEATRKHVVANPGVKVWEYKRSSLPFWERWGIPVTHVPVGYVQEMTYIPNQKDKDIDLFFSGVMNPRRSHIIDQQRMRGLKVVVVDKIFGPERDALISRSKIVLNIHFYEGKWFEICRVAQAISNHKAVLSEVSCDWEEYKWLEQGIALTEYDRFVYEIKDLLANPAKLEVLEEKGFDIFSKVDEKEILKEALC